MKILITSASKHGSTTEIADVIGSRLRVRGHDVDVVPATTAGPPDGYDVVIVGSAPYAGSWLSASRDFVDRNADALSSKRVWLFSSGPLEERGSAGIPAAKVDRLTALTGSRGHHVFAGRLDLARWMSVNDLSARSSTHARVTFATGMRSPAGATRSRTR